MTVDQLSAPTPESVNAALFAAIENGFDFAGMTPREIAEDICAYDWMHENCDPQAVEKIVEEIFAHIGLQSIVDEELSKLAADGKVRLVKEGDLLRAFLTDEEASKR
jgi:hypothetical protein